MARRKSRARSRTQTYSRSNPYQKRDNSLYIANQRLLSDILSSRPDLRPFEDRRTFHPQGVTRPARSFKSSRHRLEVPRAPRIKKIQASAYPSFHIGFESPKRVLVCVRRKQRQEVIHALGHSGSGKRRKRRSRRSEYSSIIC